MGKQFFGGCDVGSTYGKCVILDEAGKIAGHATVRSKINPVATAKEALAQAIGQVDGLDKAEDLSYLVGTGYGRNKVGHISDKTLYIALNYQDKVDKLNSSVVDEVAGQLIKTEQEQSRLEYYVSLLEPRQAEVIRRIYFKPESQGAVAKALNISVRTVQVVKAQAIDAFAELYSLTDR